MGQIVWGWVAFLVLRCHHSSTVYVQNIAVVVVSLKHSRCPTVNVRVAEQDVVAIGTIIAICSGTYTVILSAFVLVMQILYKPILVDVTRESHRVYPFL